MFKNLKNSKGATAIEYALIASLIAVSAITAMKALGKTLFNTWYMTVVNNIAPDQSASTKGS